MARSANFAYQDPTAAIGSNLVRAIFGDPQAAAQQAQERAKADALAAQAEENRAHARVYGGQTTEQGRQTTAADGYSTPEFYQKWFGTQAPSAPTMAVPAWNAAPEVSEQPMRPGEPEAPADREARARDGMAQMILMMARANGEDVDPTKIIGALGAASGVDALQRTGVIAQGNTPGATFAGTPDRADDIAAQGYGAKQSLAESVATINNRDDVPVANIQAGASRYGADTRERSSNFATSTRAATGREVADARAAAARDKTERKEADRAAARRSRPISVSSFKKLDKVVADQLDGRGLQSPPLDDGTPGASRLDPGVNTWIRTRAIENFRQSGNFLDAATKAIEAAVKASAWQKAERATRAAAAR